MNHSPSGKSISRPGIQICGAALMVCQRSSPRNTSWMYSIRTSCSYSAAGGLTASRACSGRETDSCSCIRGSRTAASNGRGMRKTSDRSLRRNSGISFQDLPFFSRPPSGRRTSALQTDCAKQRNFEPVFRTKTPLFPQLCGSPNFPFSRTVHQGLCL